MVLNPQPNAEVLVIILSEPGCARIFGDASVASRSVSTGGQDVR
jgi:hypothetical protein